MINENVRVLIAAENEGIETAAEFARIYNKVFKVKHCQLIKYEAAMEKARNENMTHMLYFLNGTDVLLSSFSDEMGGYTLEATVDDLKKVLSQNAHDSL